MCPNLNVDDMILIFASFAFLVALGSPALVHTILDIADFYRFLKRKWKHRGRPSMKTLLRRRRNRFLIGKVL